MSANANIDTVKAIYEAFGQGDAAAILEKVTDDVDWSAEAASNSAPWWGQRTGKEAAGKFFEDIAGAMDVQEFTPLSFAANDTEVMTLIRFRVTAKSTGKEAAMNLHHYFRFDDDGKVAQYRGTEDTEQTAAVLAG